MDFSRRPLIIIAGPTAVGKTAVSVALAKEIDGEIVSADSVQVYRGLDIGSAKVTNEEMEGIPHHLIDVCDVTENYDVTRFQTMAEKAIEEIYQRGHIPILVGGTGFYIQALLYGIDFTEEPEAIHADVRAELEREAEMPEGAVRLYAELLSVDPASCEKIHPHNIRRIIRALSFYRIHHSPISLHNEEEHARRARYDSMFFVLTDDREILYQRIDQRVDRMMEQGLMEEVKWLYGKKLPPDSTALKGIGYRELLDVCDKRATMDDAVAKIKLNSRHYAKRQLTWFRRERDVIYINIGEVSRDKQRITAWITEQCMKHYQ